MSIHNLPPFRPNARFPRPTQAGTWVPTDNTLSDLSNSLLIEGKQDTPGDEPIRAIPDPWAQPRTFAEAVLDPNHSMHARFIGEWRGLIALIALRDLLSANYTLDLKTVPLGDGHIFDRVLSHLAPQKAITGTQQLWLKPVIVYVRPVGRSSIPLAMLNPASLIALGRTNAGIVISSVPWMRGGLIDPLSLPGKNALPVRHLVVLAAYLRKMIDALADRPGRVASDLRQRLQEYAVACEAETEGVPFVAQAVAAQNPDLDPLYQPLWTRVTLNAVEDAATTSQTRLKLRPDFALDQFKGMILVDEGIEAAFGRQARTIPVWGMWTLRELLDSEETYKQIQEEAGAAGYLLVRAADLLTDRAARLNKGPLIPGHSISLQAALLPVRPVALLLDGDLGGMIEGESDLSRLTATLSLKICNTDGTFTSVALTQHYRTEQEGKRGLLVDQANWFFSNATVWPNIRSSAWSVYLARLYSRTDGAQVRPRYALSAQIIRAALQEAQDERDAIGILGRINAGGSPGEDKSWFRRSQLTADRERDEIQISDQGFDAIFYTDSEDVQTGCVVLKLKSVEPGSVGQASSVAVDFGTTNTVACRDNSETISFAERLVHPISFQKPENVRQQHHLYRWHFAEFLPPGQRPTPNPTVTLTRKGGRADARYWAFRNMIYFAPQGSHAVGGADSEIDKFEGVINRAKFNLKWSEDSDRKDGALDFLGQFMTMVAVELADQGRDPHAIEWHFSIPDSMSPNRAETFKRNLDKVARESNFGKIMPLFSEGLSAAKYILAGRSGSGFNKGTINIILDIGGGTTDASIWDRDDLVWKGSFQIAGQAFFTRFIAQNPAILGAIGLGHWAELLNPAAAGDGPQSAKRIDAKDLPYFAELLFSGPALSKAMADYWENELMLDTGNDLRGIALVFVAGIAHYLGLVVKGLKLDPATLTEPAFALCGRGAGLFSMMHGDTPPSGSSAVTRALTIFSRAAGIEGTPRPRLFIEREAKVEVVRGMLTAYRNINAEADLSTARDDHFPAGVAIEMNDGSSIAASDEVRKTAFVGRSRSIDFAGFDDFVAGLAAIAKIGVDLKPGDREAAYGSIRTEVQSMVDGLHDSGDRIEPPFIMALRELIAELAAPENVRRDRLSMSRL